ncbi:MAG: hypothetical protein IT320_02435 [Anaerolineae bacterium]|nr:hypothetical protein [Anaerolineae bacterium]
MTGLRQEGLLVSNTDQRWPWRLVFALVLIVPSLGIIQRFVGSIGVVAYVLGVGIITIWGWDLIPKYFSSLTTRQATLAFIVILAVLIGAFLILYPYLDSGQIGGGNDSDDALDIAVTELLRGHFPYYERTYLGNRISPMPGALWLAAPFVLLGASALQNLFWLAALGWFLARVFQDARVSLFYIVTLLALSPVVLYSILTGNDSLSNSIYVTLAIWGLVILSDPDHKWHNYSYGAAFFLGVSLSSRANFLLILPLVFSLMAQLRGWKEAFGYFLIVGAAATLVTLPYYLTDPGEFSPLHAAHKLGQFDNILPQANLKIIVLAGLAAVICAHPRWNHDLAALFRNCAIVQAIPAIALVTLATLRSGMPDFNEAGYGLFYLIFALSAFWLSAFVESTAGSSRRGSLP